MLKVLMESEPKKEKRLGGTTLSVVLHAIIITLFVAVTAKAGIPKPEKEDEGVTIIETPKDEPPPRKEKAPPPPHVLAAPPPKGFPVLSAPIEIPDEIPEVDVTKDVTNEDDFSGRPMAEGVAEGIEGGTGPVNPDQAYFEFQVEKPALTIPGGAQPKYPDLLRDSNVEGEVLAEFVVDTTGRADMKSFKVLESSHDLFEGSVRSVLPLMRFHAAEVGGRKVKQLVHQSFTFRINR